ncbi:23S rRNA (adenine(2503)-C(2))-methyltransferase RlmN [Ancylobacter sp. A5.8]|uniref:23S rRNA (adenine(2503)-C(2))-methyltransferase RlmN n=1 Tax=Ancylobacter gelatini TaxID=2919920 RepID=UPI001F4D451C|nr:23S rRNA (adenine(2503)-C(2))-methyltransferase RlmN [Ancylobacter gelatini]MCJ8143986.1 23S rRNA (adenine(2503)-C(2))-methyltransferase RlmN [Ancylobacter gelatini]
MATLIDTVPASADGALGAVAHPAVEDARRSLAGLDRAGLSQALADIGLPERERRMRVSQLWHWIYLRGATSFDEMTNVGKGLREKLSAAFTLDRPEVVVEQVSNDGTRKWLLRLPPDIAGDKPHDVEMVYIPESDRGTLCVSSQVGCTLNCSFCHTGTQRLVRNLTAAEIVAQVMVARDRLGDYPGRDRAVGPGLPTEGDRLVTNIVFMGMGEPLYAYDSVALAIDILADGEGLGIGKRRITVSTSGVVPEIEKLGRDVGPMLAISLHAVRDELRDVLVPINKKYPLKDLLEACRTYPAASNAKRITFEYVMLKGVNDSPADAKALVKLLAGIPAKINLIPFNPWPGTKYECSDWETIETFSDIVFRAGYSSPVRTPRGRDILAACGQLKSETEKLTARERLALRAMAAAAE